MTFTYMMIMTHYRRLWSDVHLWLRLLQLKDGGPGDDGEVRSLKCAHYQNNIVNGDVDDDDDVVDDDDGDDGDNDDGEDTRVCSLS